MQWTYLNLLFGSKHMIIKRLLVLLSLALVFSFEVGASESKFSSIISPFSKNGVSVGVAIHDTKTGKEIYSYKSKQSLNPASTMKVLTSVVSLKHLGGSYTYRTAFTTDSYSKGVIHNLYIKGVGDPSIVEERLWRIAKDLAVRGVKKISGDIIIDNSFFDSFSFSGKEGSNARAYNASISPFAINFNSFSVVAKNHGSSLSVKVDPPTKYFSLKSTIKGSGNSIGIDRSYQDGKEKVKAGGGVSHEKVKYANVVNPVEYAGSTLSWLLSQVGIEFTGETKGGIAKGKKRLLVDKSKPLSLIIRGLNKYSNNFTAEMILKTLASIKGGKPGSTHKGLVILDKYLKRLGVNPAEYSIHNGSGLSRKNRLSANMLNQVLLSAHKNIRIRSDFISSLSIAGTDGTLKTRFKSAALKGNVKAKTGTLHDVSALSGYIETQGKKLLAFTILVNGPGAGGGGYYRLQEALMTSMYNNY